jgi:hypothetical protein
VGSGRASDYRELKQQVGASNPGEGLAGVLGRRGPRDTLDIYGT